MNRRELLNAGINGTVLAAVGAMNMGEKLLEQGAVQRGKDQLQARLDDLEQRFDKLEHHHKNLVRVGAIAVTVSTGIDVITFL